MRNDWAQEQGSNCTYECPDNDWPSYHNPYYEITQCCESTKLVNSSDWGVNSSLTSKLKASKEVKTRFNMNEART